VSDRTLLLAKLLAAAGPAVVVTWGAAMLNVIGVAVVSALGFGTSFLPTSAWLLAGVVLAPLCGVAAALVGMRASMRSKDVQAAVQVAGLWVVPAGLVLVGIVGRPALRSLIAGAVASVLVAAVDWWLFRGNERRFEREEIRRAQLAAKLEHGTVFTRAALDASSGRLLALSGTLRPFDPVPNLRLQRTSFTDVDLGRLLDKAGLTYKTLQCGCHVPYFVENGVAPAPESIDERHNNCSGKHAGFLAHCVQQGWPVGNYLAPGHPLQQAVLMLEDRACRHEGERFDTGPSPRPRRRPDRAVELGSDVADIVR
jgi:hypothetical protein